MAFRILAVGDVVGAPGREAVHRLVPRLRKDRGIDFVVVNGENTAGGAGITPGIANDFFEHGVDVITTGDHIWRRGEIVSYLGCEPRLLRPANYAPGAAGSGRVVRTSASGVSVAVVNLQGRLFMDPIDSPFQAVERALEEVSGQARLIVVDMHAEATSEKIAMGWFLDGRVTAVVGTHTHVQTADERILPGGTAYLTDLGMTGPYRSVLGREVEPVLKHLLHQMREKFDVATDDVRLSGALITADPETGRAEGVERVICELPAAKPGETSAAPGSPSADRDTGRGPE